MLNDGSVGLNAICGAATVLDACTLMDAISWAWTSASIFLSSSLLGNMKNKPMCGKLAASAFCALPIARQSSEKATKYPN